MQALRDAGDRLATLVTARAALAKAEGLQPGQINVDVLEGAPAKQLSKRARAVEAELIVVGRHGRRAIADVFVGTTAQKVLRLGEVPLLLVQLDPTVAYERVLVGVALESGSSRVLKASRFLAPEASVEAFHASHVPFEDYVALSGELATTYRQQSVGDASSELEELVAKNGLEATCVVKAGDPRPVLLEEAKAFGAQLLVLGSHGKKGLERLVLGSVAEWVATHASTDVLVIRT